MNNITVEGIEITPVLISVLKDMAPAGKTDISRPAMHVEIISEIQDLICRHLSEFPEHEQQSIFKLLESIVLAKDDLKQICKIWEGN